MPRLAMLRVARPCRESWQNMVGDDAVRACGRCAQLVYNLSAMRTDDVEALLAGDGRVCVRFYRRADGTVMTADCGARSAVPRVAAAVVAAGLSVAAAATAIGALPDFAEPPKTHPWQGEAALLQPDADLDEDLFPFEELRDPLDHDPRVERSRRER